MKLAIFGDSYADTADDYKRISWPNILKDRLDDVYVKGLCGTSIWWSYRNFLEYMQNNKPDCVIFCHTNPYRWPSLPKEIHGQNWNIHSVNTASLTTLLSDLNKYYYDLFPPNLSDFLALSVFREVNEYCKNNNIYLINILCFSFTDVYTHPTQFPVLNNIDKISHFERIRYIDNNVYSVIKMVEKFKMVHGDPRRCHYGTKNNKRLADILYDMLHSKPTNLQQDMMTAYEWDEFDETNDELFAIKVKEYT